MKLIELAKGGIQTDLRQRIIDSSLVLFEQYGFHRVSVKQIVEAAGVSKGGFYHHFSTKGELLFVIHDIFISFVLERATIGNEKYKSPTKRLDSIIADFVSVFDVYKAHLTVFYQEYNYLEPEHEAIVKNKRNRFKGIIKQVIQDGVDNGEFRKDLSVDITTMAILGMVNWTYKWYQRDGEKTIEEIANYYIDFMMQAILTDIAPPEEEQDNISSTNF